MTKSQMALLSMAMMASAFTSNQPRSICPEDIDVTPKEPIIPKGCKKYTFGEFETIASSEKSARKKHDKWLKKQ
jgi:hypothetical protein